MVTFNIDPSTFGDDVLKEIQKDITEARREASSFMKKRIELTYTNKGYLDTSNQRGVPEWTPTTFIAKKNRKSFPRSGSGVKSGKKGLTQQQSRYLWASPTLIDTGALLNSITEEEELFSPVDATSFIGAGLPYIATHEEGGDFEGHDVPARPSQFITEDEDNFIVRIFKRWLGRA